MNEEIYPMPSFPNLVVQDLEASSKFYQTALGFQHIFTMPGPQGTPSLVHLRWVKYADLLLSSARGDEELTGPKGVGISLNFSMFDRFNGDMAAFATHTREHGASMTGPIDRPWNVREVSVVDPDGYKLVFTVPINVNLNFEEMLERVKKDEERR